jgi:hypothetical protein
MAISSTSGKNPPPKGRPKGVPNKMTRNVRQMILASLDHRGGVAWLDALPDADYCRLVARVIPQEIDARHDGQITVQIIKSGDGK